ncbi:MAG: tetratricopeptide repeat protein [candidate division WOR-3 bacterium]
MILLIFVVLNEACELYNAGNKYYAEGNFQNAIECYEKALSLCQNKDIYYNLGNAYFKMGKIGKALIQYRRAYFLCPRDGDVNYNLSFLRNFRADRITSIPNPIAQILNSLFHYFSMAEAFVYSALSFLFFAIFLSLFIIGRNKLFIWIAFVGLLFFGYFFITTQVWQGERNSNSGVIICGECQAFSGPAEDYKEVLVIHDGTEVKIRDERNDYYLIQLPGGLGGWVKTENVARVY